MDSYTKKLNAFLCYDFGVFIKSYLFPPVKEKKEKIELLILFSYLNESSFLNLIKPPRKELTL